jgi:nucleotide-binding universal stress UspA family protein
MRWTLRTRTRGGNTSCVGRDTRSASVATVCAGTLCGVIIVGVDGSNQSSAALEWAAREARVRNDALRVVCAWHVEANYGLMGFVPPVSVETFARAARETVSSMLDAHAEALRGIQVEPIVVPAPAAEALVQAAEDADADLLVVGSHGHGAVLTMLLGSVSLRTVHLASCPVVVVRTPPQAEEKHSTRAA